MSEVRGISTRARITPTSFVNEYNWGDFRGDVLEFLTRYYDAHLYIANWGTRWFGLRIPMAHLDAGMAEAYGVSEFFSICPRGESAVLMWQSDDEDGDWGCEDDVEMSSLAPLREDILSGDLRSLYLGWLQAVACDCVEEDEMEPMVPQGLKELNAPLCTLADFLRIDETLVAVAAEASAPLRIETDSAEKARAWIKSLPVQDKDAMLHRLMQEPAISIQREMQRRFRLECQPIAGTEELPRRTVGQIRAAWVSRMDEASRQAAEARAKEEARQRELAARMRKRHLDDLALREPAAWKRASVLIQTCQPKKYDEAVQLLQDLYDVADREGRAAEAKERLSTLREKHRRKPSLITRLDAAKL